MEKKLEGKIDGDLTASGSNSNKNKDSEDK